MTVCRKTSVSTPVKSFPPLLRYRVGQAVYGIDDRIKVIAQMPWKPIDYLVVDILGVLEMCFEE